MPFLRQNIFYMENNKYTEMYIKKNSEILYFPQDQRRGTENSEFLKTLWIPLSLDIPSQKTGKWSFHVDMIYFE